MPRAFAAACALPPPRMHSLTRPIARAHPRRHGSPYRVFGVAARRCARCS
jgi:hypothetical protein